MFTSYSVFLLLLLGKYIYLLLMSFFYPLGGSMTSNAGFSVEDEENPYEDGEISCIKN